MTKSEVLDALERFARESPSRVRRAPVIDRTNPGKTILDWAKYFADQQSTKRPAALYAMLLDAVEVDHVSR